MKKLSLIGFLSIVLNVFLLADAFYFHYVINPFASHDTHQHDEHCGHLTRKNPHRVAILTPVSHPSLEQIEKGFIETLNKENPGMYECTTYNANGDRTLMRSQAEEIVQNDYSLIFTIGTGTSKMAKEITAKKEKLTPIVYGAVGDPLGMDLVASLESSGNNLTGVTEPRNIPLQIALLKAFKPNLKSVLIAYDPGQDRRLEKDKDQFTAGLQKEGVQVKSVEIYQINEISQKIPPFLDDTDVLLILKDNTLVSGMESLVRLCSRSQVTIYASDLDSSDNGAALAFGVPEYEFGVDAAHKARKILEEKQAPSTIASTPVDAFKIKINIESCKEQGLNVDPILLFVGENTIIKR